MIYIIARELGNGYAEYVADIPHMLLTLDPDLAQQLGDEDLEKMDMPYMNREGFFAVDISRMGIMIRPEQRFHPPMLHFRPRIVHRKAGPLMVRPPRPLVPVRRNAAGRKGPDVPGRITLRTDGPTGTRPGPDGIRSAAPAAEIRNIPGAAAPADTAARRVGAACERDKTENAGLERYG